jgi:hypothetical protein
LVVVASSARQKAAVVGQISLWPASALGWAVVRRASLAARRSSRPRRAKTRSTSASGLGTEQPLGAAMGRLLQLDWAGAIGSQIVVEQAGALEFADDN